MGSKNVRSAARCIIEHAFWPDMHQTQVKQDFYHKLDLLKLYNQAKRQKRKQIK